MAINSVSIGSYRQRQTVVPAFGLALVIIVMEYLARHFAAFWLPAVGMRRVNEMVMVGLAYAALVWFMLPREQQQVGVVRQALRSIVASGRRWQVWVGALAALVATLGLMAVDTALWATLRLPRIASPWQWNTTLLGSAGTGLSIAAIVLVNAIIVPFAEEWLWRGKIQPFLATSWGIMPALVLTAVLFSFKHALMDASFGRMLAITGFGLVMGVVGARYGWRAAALAHAITNATATLLMFLATGSV